MPTEHPTVHPARPGTRPARAALRIPVGILAAFAIVGVAFCDLDASVSSRHMGDAGLPMVLLALMASCAAVPLLATLLASSLRRRSTCLVIAGFVGLDLMVPFALPGGTALLLANLSVPVCAAAVYASRRLSPGDPRTADPDQPTEPAEAAEPAAEPVGTGSAGQQLRVPAAILTAIALVGVAFGDAYAGLLSRDLGDGAIGGAFILVLAACAALPVLAVRLNRWLRSGSTCILLSLFGFVDVAAAFALPAPAALVLANISVPVGAAVTYTDRRIRRRRAGGAS